MEKLDVKYINIYFWVFRFISILSVFLAVYKSSPIYILFSLYIVAINAFIVYVIKSKEE